MKEILLKKIASTPSLFVLTLTFIGFLLRTINITNNPPLDVDEYSIAYNAYAIAKEGIDEWGERFPLFFKAFGDYKLAFDIYFISFFLKIFQPNVFLIRLPAIILGTLYIPLMFIFLKQVTKNNALVYLGTILMTFSSSGIFFSRIISGSISQSFFIFLSILLFVLFLKKKKGYFLFLSILSISLSLYVYPSSWIVAPIICFFYFLIIFWQKKYKFLLLFFIFIISFIPIIKQYFWGGSKIRYTNITNNLYTGQVLEINEFRHHSKNDLLSKIFHNKLIYYSYTFLKNYLNHFDIDILAYGRDIIYIENSPFPVLFFVTLPFYYLGLFTLFKRYKNPIFLIIAIWVLASPLPSAITGIHSKRFLSFLGSDIILIILGLEKARLPSKKYLFLIFYFLLFFQIGYFLYNYFFIYQKKAQSKLFFNGSKLVTTISNNYNNYDLIVYAKERLGEPQIYPLFATLFSPKKYVQIKKYQCDPWCYIKPFDKFYFDKDLNKIIQVINQNIKNKKILGFFSQTDITNLKKSTCFKIKKKYTPPDKSSESYLEVEFMPCGL